MDVQMPDGTLVTDVPEGTTRAQLLAKLSGANPPEAATKPEFSLPGYGQVTTPPTENGFNLPAAVIGAGATGNKLEQGVRQAKLAAQGTVYQALSGLPGIGNFFADQAQQNAQQTGQQDAQMSDEAKRYAQLRQVQPGSTLLGEVAPLLPLSSGAMTSVAGLSYGSPMERAKNTGLVLAGNALAQQLGKTATKQYQASADATALAKSQNSVRDATLQAGQDVGLVVPPATVNPSFLNRTLEGVSGKAATQQAVSGRNAQVVDDLIRRELGMAQGAPITTPAMRSIRSAAYKSGYEPVAAAGTFPVSPEYNAALDAITANATNASKSFPGAATPDIASVVDSFRPPNGVFDAAHAIDATKTLRQQASDLYLMGENSMAKARTGISNEIENELARQLANSGQDGATMLQKFQAARQLIAKTHTVEDAIREGAGTAEASGIAKATQRGAPLTGNLKTIGDFANTFPKATQKVSQIGSPGVSALDATVGSLLAAAGGAAGGPLGVAAGAAPFIVRPAARGLILSPLYQKLLAQPKYATKGLLGSAMLDNKMAPYLAGLLSYEAANR